MMASVFARKTHKWIALIVGIQATIWLISGAYFTILDADYIHGDHLIRNIDEPINNDVGILYSFAAVLERYPQATRVDLISRLGRPHYLVVMDPISVLLDAHSGKIKGPIGKNFAVSLAKYYYAGDGDVAKAALLTDELEKPIEIWGTLPTPTSLICAENDKIDPIGQCWEFYRGLKQNHVASELLIYKGVGHSRSVWSSAQQSHSMKKKLNWFERYLSEPH